MLANALRKSTSVKLFDACQATIVRLVLLCLIWAWSQPSVATEIRVRTCESLLAGTRAKNLGDAESTELSKLRPGAILTLTAGTQSREMYFLGRENVNGRKRLVLLARRSMAIVRVYDDQIDDRVHYPIRKGQWLLTASYQGQNPTCAAHAATACLLSHSEEFRSLAIKGESSIGFQRYQLINEATRVLYNESDELFNDKVQTFLANHGVESRALILDSPHRKDELLKLLKSGHAVYLAYPSEHKFTSDTNEVIDEKGISEERSSGHMPQLMSYSNSLNPRRHAVVLLKAFESNGSTFVLVLDSASGQLRVWFWGDIERANPRAPLHVLIPGQKEVIHSSGLPESTLSELKNTHRAALADFATGSPERLRPINNKSEWFVSDAVVGQWVIIRRGVGTTARHESQFLAGRISEVGVNSHGQNFVVVQPYRFGKLSDARYETDRFETVWQIHSSNLSDIHVITPPQNQFTEIFSQASIGDQLSFQWSETPFAPPVFVKGPVLKKEKSTLHVFDLATNRILEIGAGEMASDYALEKATTWKRAERALRAGFAEAVEQIERAAGRSFYGEGPKKRLLKGTLVYPTLTPNLFDTALLQSGTRVMVTLKEGYIMDKLQGREYRSAEGTIEKVDGNEFTLSFTYAWKRLRLTTKEVESIFVLPEKE